MNPVRTGVSPVLFGRQGHTSVSRGLAEIHGRRPILMSGKSETLLALPVEGLDAERLNAFVNLCAPRFGLRQFDPPPFQVLQGIVSFLALITTTVVLAAQNRQGNLERQRMHLDLQINLLSEQKVSKCIHLLEELRRDMPFVPDRYDEQAALLQHRADADEVITALKKGGLTHEPNQASSDETKP